MAVLAAFSLIYLQGLFDKSDHRKAIAAVRQHQARPGAPTLGGFLASSSKGAVTFSATLVSGCRGVVQVDAHLEDGGLLSFEVDLITQAIEPVNGAAGRALTAYREAVEPDPGATVPEPGASTPQAEAPTP